MKTRSWLLRLCLVLLVSSLVPPRGVAQAPSPNPLFAKAVWVGVSEGLLKLLALDGSLLLEVSGLKELRALAVDDHRYTVWVITDDSLLAFGFDGTRQLAMPMRLHEGSKALLAVNTADGSVWLANDEGLRSFSAAGQALLSLPVDGEIRAISIDPGDELVWAATAKSVVAYDALAGTVVRTLALAHHPEVRDLSADASTKSTWVAEQDGVQHFAMDGTSLLTAQLRGVVRVSAAANGSVWAAAKDSLVHLSGSGQILGALRPFGGDGDISRLTSDPSDGSAWVASEREVAHVDAAGQLLRVLEFDPPVKVRSLAAYADVIPPQLEILLPAQGSFINRHSPGIEVSYSDVGSGVDASSLAFQLAGAALAMSCTGGESGATCTPTSPIPDGPAAVTARVKDLAGNSSQPASVNFTIDTVPPVITLTRPQDGALTNQPQQIVAGSLSKTAALTINGQQATVATDLSFSTSVTLQEGLNAITLSAADRAGNTAQLTIKVTLDTVPPNPVDPQRVTVSAVVNGQVTVSAGPGAAEAGAVASVSNVRTGQAVSVTAAADGSFTTAIGAQGGDMLAIVLTDAAGNRSQAVSVVVPAGTKPPTIPPDPSTLAPPLDPTVATAFATATQFLYSGSTAIQTGVVTGAIDRRTVSVVRGKVMNRDGSAVPGVKISVFSHPEVGSTLSRQDGMFDLAINAGGIFMLRYEKDGFVPAYHRVKAFWRSYASAEDAVLVPYDGQVTKLTLGGANMQVGRGGVVADGSGSRQATLLLPPGTQAQMVMPDGTSQPLASLSFRATEFTVGANGPAAMPGPLPPTSGYTYAVELSADEAVAAGADTVAFSQPVLFYVENFLGFPVGPQGAVPVGYFDRRLAAWAPLPNGMVLKVLGTTGGLADLDLDGLGQPASAAELAAAGIADGERQQLAVLYAPGQALWRVALDHFSAHDLNWPLAPPPDAVPPDQPPPQADQPADQPDCEEGSIIEAQNQTLGEDLPLSGTPFGLRYRSDRTPGRRNIRQIVVPLTGATVAASLSHVQLRISVAGQTFSQTFSNAPDQSYTFQWDGNDAYGRTMHGSVPAYVQVGFSYPAFYVPPASVTASFGRGAAAYIASVRIPARAEWTFWSESQVLLASRDIRTFGAAGWTLTPHHAYDPDGRVVLQGDGTTRTFSARGLSAVAPGNVGAFGAMDTQGNIYTLDQAVVRKIAPNGALTVVAGNGIAGYSGDGGPAIQAMINSPLAVAVDSSGNIYLDDNARIRRVDPRGIVTTVAGDGHPLLDTSNIPDGTVATSTDLTPFTITLDPNGVLYLAQSIPTGSAAGGVIRVIWRLEAGGLLTKIYSGFSYNYLHNIAADGLGNVYFSDNDGVTKIAESGLVTSVVGLGGPPAYPLTGAYSFAVDAAGDLFVADGSQHRIVEIFPNGSFTLLPVAVDSGGLLVLGPQGDPVMSTAAGVQRLGPAVASYVPAGLNIPSADGGQVFVFSSDGRHLRTVDPLTGAILYSFAYDAAQRLAGITDVDGNTTQIQRDAQGNVAAIVAPFGQVTHFATGADGELAGVTDPANQTTAFTYSQGLMASMTDARGGLYQFSYDGAGRLTRDQDPAAGIKQLSRTVGPSSYQVAVTTALGLTSGYAVTQLPGTNQQWITTDPAGVQEVSIVGQDGSRTDATADGFVASLVTGPEPRFLMTAPLPMSGQLTTPSGLSAYFTRSRSVVLSGTGDPLSLSTLSDSWSVNGRVYSQTFDRSRMLQTFQTAGGRQFISTVNAAGRPTSLQVGSLDALQLAYDPQGRLATEAQGSGTAQRTMGFSYGADGRLGSLTDTLQRKFSFAWDGAGRMVSQTLPDGRMVGFGYDANGNLTSVTPPGRQPHKFAFTPVDQALSYTPPDLGSGPAATTYTYDLDRRLTGISRPDGKTVLFGYQQGRLSSLSFDGGVIGLAYDPGTGLLKTVSAPAGETLSFAYDGPLSTKTSWTGPVAGSVESSFDRNFRVASQTINGQQPIAFQYDGDGLVFAAGDLGIFRDPGTGQPQGMVLGTALTSQLYNSFGELSSSSATYSGTEFFREDFTRDAAGRIVHKVETISGASDTYDYSYDAAGRLTDVRKDGAQLSHYDYDANSNRISAQEGSTTTQAAYDAQDRLLSWGDTTYTYNASGDLTSKVQSGVTVTYGSDALGNLATVVDANGVQSDYIVDGQNRRVGKRVAGVLVQEFLWLDRLKVAAELDGAGNIVSRFVYGTRANVPGMMIRNGVEYLIVTDQLGSPRLVMDSGTGDIAQRLDYDAWGRVTLDSNPGFQPFGFAGGLYDPRTGLVRFGARDYDPGVGRWTARDPALFGGGAANLYGYVLSDPVDLTDPNGLDTFDCTINLGGGRNPDLDGHCPLGACHEYLCVIDEHFNVTCGGQGPAGGGGSGQSGQEWLRGPVPGGNDNRGFNRKHCPLVSRNHCVDKCVKELLEDHAGRPPYQMFNWYGGRNCWGWAQDVLAACMMRCNPQ